MIFIVAAIMAGSMGLGQAPNQRQTVPNTPVPSKPLPDTIPEPAVAPPAKNLPPPPPGKSTVIGGAIRKVDPVRDEITLKLFGSNDTMKIFYDERTQMYRNGRRIDVLELKPESHASVETTLDGTKVFALRIHILGTLPEGDCQGQVESFDGGSRVLIVSPSLSKQSIRIDVPDGTPIIRVGQSTFASEQSGIGDLMRGSLVNVKFQAGDKGRGVATHIDVMATPGSQFSFTGQISLLDFSRGRLDIVNPRDNQTYSFHFDPRRFHSMKLLHEGSTVSVTAEFDGQQYQVTDVSSQ